MRDRIVGVGWNRQDERIRMTKGMFDLTIIRQILPKSQFDSYQEMHA